MHWTEAEYITYLAKKVQAISGEVKTDKRYLKEAELQIEAESWLKRQGIFYIHLYNPKRNKAGIPDIILANPYDNGRLYASELKIGKRKMTKEQQITIALIKRSKGKAAVCRDLQEFMQFVIGG